MSVIVSTTQAAVRLFHARLQLATDAKQAALAATFAAGLAQGLRLAGTLTADQAADFERDCDFEAARKCEELDQTPPHAPRRTDLLPGLQYALNCVHAGMSPEQLRTTLRELIADNTAARAA